MGQIRLCGIKNIKYVFWMNSPTFSFWAPIGPSTPDPIINDGGDVTGKPEGCVPAILLRRMGKPLRVPRGAFCNELRFPGGGSVSGDHESCLLDQSERNPTCPSTHCEPMGANDKKSKT